MKIRKLFLEYGRGVQVQFLLLFFSLVFFNGECTAPTSTKKYIVTLNANHENAGSSTTIEVESGKTAPAPATVPVRAGYKIV